MNLKTGQLFLVAALLTLGATGAKAQDLLVTKRGDSISCKIVKMENEKIYYLFPGQAPPPGTFRMSDIAAYYYNFYERPITDSTLFSPKPLYPHWRAGVSAGWSQRTAPIADNTPAQLKEYMRDLKSGLSFNVDVTYFFVEKVGVGLKYNLHRSKAEIGSYTSSALLKDDIHIHYIGPYLCARLYGAQQKNSLLLGMGMGYTHYKDEGFYKNETVTIIGKTLAFSYDIGYDIQIAKNFMLGLQLSLTGGALSRYTLTKDGKTETVKLSDDEYEGLGRLDLSVGLRFIK
ncbi:MAG: OmpW family outer membrane protein [Bacteroidales bacterium]|jgi:outer membrane protein W|nr:OmpW family outer membrane protein [Bacteroidales bacterium]